MLEDDLFGHRKGAFPDAVEHRAGLLRKVDEGTLVLEDIDNLSMEIQTRLIQTARGKAVRPLGDDVSYPTDVRILATTTGNLYSRVSQGNPGKISIIIFRSFPCICPHFASGEKIFRS